VERVRAGGCGGSDGGSGGDFGKAGNGLLMIGAETGTAGGCRKMVSGELFEI